MDSDRQTKLSSLYSKKFLFFSFFKATTRNFQGFFILAPPWTKAVVAQVPTVYKSLIAHARQAELSMTPATRAFVLEASEREMAVWMVMRSCVYM